MQTSLFPSIPAAPSSKSDNELAERLTSDYGAPGRLTVSALATAYGYDDLIEFVEFLMMDSVVPALCDDGCEVEPDGHCEHGHPSPLIALGMI